MTITSEANIEKREPHEVGGGGDDLLVVTVNASRGISRVDLASTDRRKIRKGRIGEPVVLPASGDSSLNAEPR